MTDDDRMRAVLVTRFGGPEVLRLAGVPVPAPGRGEVLVRLAVAGINFSDISWRTGRRGGAPPIIDGSEGAGIVAAVGPGVDGVAVGDRVAYWNPAMGSYAEYALCPAFRIVRLPDAMDFGTAAALMLQGFTAHYLVRSVFPVDERHTVLFHAGAGGVGQIVIQLAKAHGARVLVTVGSAEKAAFAQEIGADAAIPYRETDFVAAVRDLTDGEGVDVVYDAVGAATWQGSLSLVRATLRDFVADADEIAWRAGGLFDLWAESRLKVRIGETYPLADAARAHADLEGRRTTGKLLLDAS